MPVPTTPRPVVIALGSARRLQRGGWAVHATAKRVLFDWYPLIALGGVAGVVCLAVAAVRHRLSNGGEVTIGVAGIVAGFVYFVQQQRLTELKILHELFTAFNERYDALDAALNRIAEQVDGPAKLPPEDQADLFRYFNLCGEEYFFFKQDLIHRDVWHTWLAGMRWYYGRSDRIRDLWASELGKQHYYGMPVGLLEADDAGGSTQASGLPLGGD